MTQLILYSLLTLDSMIFVFKLMHTKIKIHKMLILILVKNNIEKIIDCIIIYYKDLK